MKQKIISKSLAVAVILLYVGVGIQPAIANENPIEPVLNGNTLYVGGTGPDNYTRIMNAVVDANPYDTVYVFDDSSPYYENIIVDKSINLIGENKDTTVIDGRELTNVVVFLSDGILLSGFTIINCKADPLDHCAGVRVYTNNSIINNNNICENGYNGIHLECSSKNNVISENYIAFNYDAGILISQNSNSNFVFNNIIEYNCLDGSYGGGILLYSSFDNLIDNNCIIDNYNGIKSFDSFSNKISNNSFINNSCVLVRGRENTVFRNNFTGSSSINLKYTVDNLVINNTYSRPSGYRKCGVILTYAEYNRIIGNKITKQYNGIMFNRESNSNIIEDNIIDSNYYGIKLSDTGDCNVIVGNSICYNNINGIYINESSRSIFCYNNINFNNGIGICLASNSNNNIINGNKISKNLQGINISEYSGFNNNIFHNNFFENENKTYDEFDNYWDDDYPSGGNFWDDYNGTDNDGDGIGDTPYNISGGDNQDRYPLMLPYVNQGAPERPLIGGEINVKKGKEYNYTFVTTDPDSDEVYYYIDWGDNTSSGWIGAYSSGVAVIQAHKWSNKGTYIIKAKAKDINGEESDWGYLDVIVSRTRATTHVWLHWFLERFPMLERLLNQLR